MKNLIYSSLTCLLCLGCLGSAQAEVSLSTAETLLNLQSSQPKYLEPTDFQAWSQAQIAGLTKDCAQAPSDSAYLASRISSIDVTGYQKAQFSSQANFEAACQYIAQFGFKPNCVLDKVTGDSLLENQSLEDRGLVLIQKKWVVAKKDDPIELTGQFTCKLGDTSDGFFHYSRKAVGHFAKDPVTIKSKKNGVIEEDSGAYITVDFPDVPDSSGTKEISTLVKAYLY